MRFVFVCYGMGESAQAGSLLKFVERNGVECLFIAGEENAYRYAKGMRFNSEKASDPQKVKALIKDFKPHAMLLCNSKTTRSMITEPPYPKLLAASLDSNWLFSQTSKWRIPEWIKIIFVVMPEAIFRNGLRVNGGYYDVPDFNMKKIICPGFIPSGNIYSEKDKMNMREELGVMPNETLIFAYFGRGVTRRLMLPNLIEAIKELRRESRCIKVVYAGEEECDEDWFIHRPWFDPPERYNLALSCADLVTQHHGLGTLPKAICAQVPAICFVPEIPEPRPVHSEAYEIDAFQRSGVCSSLPYSASTKTLKSEITRLLYSKKDREVMQRNQKTVFVAGEERAYEEIMRCLGNTTII